jgi:Flp pilus assembly protein TadD
MYRKSLSSMLVLLLSSILTVGAVARAQNSASNQAPAPVTILDSTKEQDGLVGSVRRVKTESAKLELKDGRVVEGPRQLLEITTYALTGNRVENVSYPVANISVGKEEYKYDDKGHIIEMTLRGEGGAILSREAYDYEFDRFGNWTKMITNLVVFEDGQLKREPVEATYRALTYFFDDSIATAVGAPSRTKMPAVPSLNGTRLSSVASLDNGPNQLREKVVSSSVLVPVDSPPPAIRRLSQEKTVSSTTPENLKADNSTSVQGAGTELSSAPLNGPSEEQRVTRPARTEQPQNLSVRSSPAAVPNTSGGPLSSAKTDSSDSKTTLNDNIAASRTAMNHYKKGSDLFEVGDINGAVGAYLQAIELEPKSAEFRLALGHAYLKLKKDKEAAKFLKESVRLNPEVAEAHYGLGLAYFRLERHKEAADAFKKATSLRSDMAKAHYGLALAYQELGRQDALIEQYRILEKLDRNLAKQLAQAFPDFNLPCRVPPFCK